MSLQSILSEMQVQIYLSEVLDWYSELSSQQEWDEKACSPTRKKLLSALDGISGYNPEGLLKRLPPDALYEERAILLGKLNQHELALSLYVHKVLPTSASLVIPDGMWAVCQGLFVFAMCRKCDVSFFIAEATC